MTDTAAMKARVMDGGPNKCWTMGSMLALIERIETLEAKNCKLRDALLYYGEGTGDMGEVARAAINRNDPKGGV